MSSRDVGGNVRFPYSLRADDGFRSSEIHCDSRIFGFAYPYVFLIGKHHFMSLTMVQRQLALPD